MLLVLNLKMNLTKYSIQEYERFIKDKEVIVLPQYPYLLFFRDGLYSLGSQDVSKFATGSYTGEVCAKGLKSLGVKYSLIGHYERKKYFKEDINDFRMKITNCVDNDIIPIYCVNQDEDDYLNDKELKNIENQLEGIPEYVRYIMIAFEPTWAIGQESANINLEHVGKILVRIKSYLMERNINHTILYGGGVNAENVDKLKTLPCLDGFIVSSSAVEIEKLDDLYNKIK